MASINGLDDLDYLTPGYDLGSLTVPRLRAILVSHDISYPASAKKAQLIQILEDEVAPIAKKLLRDRERVQRTSEGITDMSSQETQTTDDEDRHGRAVEQDRESMPPPPTPSTVSTTTGSRRGRSRRSVRSSTTDTNEEHIVSTPSRRRPSRPSKHPRASDTETGDDSTVAPAATDSTPLRGSSARKLRKSEAAGSTVPIVKTESLDGSVFTDDNPFQSGGSPMPLDQTPRALTVSGDRRRKSGSRLSSESIASKEERRKRVSGLPLNIKQEEDVIVPTRSTFDFPVSRWTAPKQEESGGDDVSAGEEFTPEQQLARDTEEASKTQAPMARRRQREQHVSRVAPWFVMLSLFGGFGAWWRKEKVDIGFCGVGKPNWSLTETKIPDWVHLLEPQCEPCPPHAFCYPNLEVQCEHDFISKPHPLSLGGIIPLPPTCEPDSEKSRRIKAVADKAVEELRDQRAKWECGDGAGAKSAEVSEHDLKRTVAKKRRRGMSDAEFDDLWNGAIGEIIARDEVNPRRNNRPVSGLRLASTSLARLPIGCALRRYIRLSFIAYRLPISILVLMFFVLAYVRSQILIRRSDIARVPDLVATTLDRLATQAALYARGGAREPWIPVGQLRDDVLRSELRGSRREELWKRVRNVVEENANVRAAVREGRGGEVSRAWEWIGGIGIGGIGSPGDGDGSGQVRFSLSPADGDVSDLSGVQSARESRKWDEGRPVY
ncbi:hypothetical protein Egran_02817 [Elaphomyces granulatus]|uniref:LEM-like domain-containing protein n=1 Tax=Elaphomyces granulatus TaxID=519963 RepID=A0A232LZ28_9EURO|nr:hypothetical protein Egran_02817 [Elaphomyces granulatus]